MPPFDFFRTRNIFNPYRIGNDLPEQGGIGGNLDISGERTIFNQPTEPFRIREDVFTPPKPVSPMPSGLGSIESVAMPSLQSELDVNEIFNKLYTPQNEAYESMRQHIDKFPERNEPGTLRKIGSVIAGLGPDGAQAQERVLYSPYHRAIEDWQNKFKPLETSANLERQHNINERQLAFNAAQSSVNARRASTAQDAENRRRAAEENKVRIANAKLELDKFKAEHPDWELVEAKDGYVYLVNPADPSASPVNTGLQHNEMSELDKMRWRQRIKQTAPAKTEDDSDDWWQSTDWVNGVPVVGRLNKRTGEFVPATNVQSGKVSQGRPHAPTQEEVARRSIANQLLSQDRSLNRYIEMDEFGVRIKGNPPQDIRDFLEQALFGKKNPGDIKINPSGSNIRSATDHKQRVLPPNLRTVPKGYKPRKLSNGTIVYEKD